MHSRRVKGPSSSAEFAREAEAMTSGGMRVPEDDLMELLQAVRNGHVLDEVAHTEATPAEHAFEAASVIRTTVPKDDTPQEIIDVLASDNRAELIEVARMLRRGREYTMVFVTPVGDIRCPVSWMSCRPDEMAAQAIVFVKIRTHQMTFVPKPGASFDIAFDGYKSVTSVVCLASPQRIYPGIDLLCFMPHNNGMEKTGKLQEGAPSVVSGKPSDAVVEDEPVVAGETPMSKSAFSTQAVDFDKVRI